MYYIPEFGNMLGDLLNMVAFPAMLASFWGFASRRFCYIYVGVAKCGRFPCDVGFILG